MEATSDDPEGEIPFKLHDFGSRGATCQEAAGIGGLAHLINFMGTDTVAALKFAQLAYGADMAGFSIPASEHSTITMWGKLFETKAYENMIKQYGEGQIFACVSDSYDIYNATENIWGDILYKQVVDMNAMLVVRPDSGDPVEVVIDIIKILDKKFGHTINSKGYKVLNHVRVIQGDGIGPDDVDAICFRLMMEGYSTTNVAFGMGGGLLQKDLNRDTHKIAFKCCWAIVNGEAVKVSKDPITDPGKKSKQGRLSLKFSGGYGGPVKIQTVNGDIKGFNLLETVYENGELGKTYTFDDLRKNSERLVENM